MALMIKMNISLPTSPVRHFLPNYSAGQGARNFAQWILGRASSLILSGLTHQRRDAIVY